MKPKTWYQIAALTSAGHTEYCLPQTNWSQYGERFARHTAEWKKSYDKNPDKKSHWPKWDVYGLPQAREHLAELKAKEPGRNFVIIKTTEKMIE